MRVRVCVCVRVHVHVHVHVHACMRPTAPRPRCLLEAARQCSEHLVVDACRARRAAAARVLPQPLEQRLTRAHTLEYVLLGCMLLAGCCLLAVACWRLLAACVAYWRLAAGGWRLAAGYASLLCCFAT